jgi:hypothetical protein
MSSAGRFIDEITESLLKIAHFLSNPDMESSNMISREMKKSWISYIPEVKNDSPVMAVDGSFGHVEMSDGISIIFAQAEVFSSNGKETTKADTYFYPSSLVEDFESRFSEDVEHRTALKALEDAPSGGYILLDGSIIARQLNAVMSFERHGVFASRYAINLMKLIDEARRRNYRIVAVSKGSRTRILSTALIRRIARKIPARNSEEEAIISSIVSGHYMGAYKLLKSGKVSPEVEELVRSAIRCTTDIRLIRSSDVSPPGRTEVLKVGPYIRSAAEILKRISRGEEAERMVMESGITHLEVSRGLITEEEVAEIASKGAEAILSFPPCALVYIWFKREDDPMKIDIPLDGSWLSTDVEFIKDPDFLQDVLGVLYDCYAGPRGHNVYLEKVDRDVKLTKEDLDIYESVLERIIGEPVRHSRSYRRYWGGL